MRRFRLSVLCTVVALATAAGVSSSYAMSFQSMPTQTNGTQFADPDEQFDNFAHPGEVGSLHLFGGRPASNNRFRNNWNFDPWYFSNGPQRPGYLTAPSKSHQ
jgi:hypothetical protein